MRLMVGERRPWHQHLADTPPASQLAARVCFTHAHRRLQDDDGTILHAFVFGPGLDYPSIGPGARVAGIDRSQRVCSWIDDDAAFAVKF